MSVEQLPYKGESSKDRFAFQKYANDIARGKSLLQLTATAKALGPDVRQSWSPRTFTGVITPVGQFDEVVCNVSYHFNKHGAKFGTIGKMTRAAKDYFKRNRQHAKPGGDGTLKLPHGTYEPDGRIITFHPDK
jgi:hypothetical protein